MASEASCCLVAIHNFIQNQDPMDINNIADPMDPELGARAGELVEGVPRAAEKDRVNRRRDQIVQQMWDQYVAYHEM